MELKNKIRLVGIDLDGTLLNDEKKLCDGAAEILSIAKDNNIHIVPVTGRPYNGIPECVRKLDAVDYIICSNGASIIEAKTKDELFSFSMSNEKSVEVFNLLQSCECIFEPFCEGVCYTEQQILDSYIGLFRGSPIEEYLLSTRVICNSIRELFEEQGICADEFFVSCENREKQSEITALLDKVEGIHYWFFGNKYIEITRSDCDKGSALKTLCDMLGVGINQTIAFGDGDNDLSFLKTAGVAVAMENAFPSVKEKADIIAKSNNDNGVCEIIKTLF